MQWIMLFVAVNHKPIATAGPTILSRAVHLMLHLEILIKIKKSLLEVYKLVIKIQYLSAGLAEK